MVTARANDFLGSDVVIVSEPEMVVYAGYDFENVPATFAYAFEAKVGGPEDVNNYQKARYIIDATSGELLRKENLIPELHPQRANRQCDFRFRDGRRRRCDRGQHDHQSGRSV